MKAVWRLLALTMMFALVFVGCGSSADQETKQVEEQTVTETQNAAETQEVAGTQDTAETQAQALEESAGNGSEVSKDDASEEVTETLEHFEVDDTERDGLRASDYCKIKKYKGLKISEDALMVTDGEVQNEVNKILNDVEDYTDEAVQQHTSFNSKKEFEKSIRKDLKEEKYKTAITNALEKKATFEEELPQVLYDYYKEMFIEYYSVMVQQYYKSSLLDYLKKNNMTLDTFYETVGIEDNVKQELIWRYIAEQENIVAEGDDFNAYVEAEAGDNGMTAEQFLSVNGESNMKYFYLKDMAYKLVRENVK